MAWRFSPSSFRRHQSGTAAIEFVLILPMLLTLYLGMVDLTAAITTTRQLSYSASVVGDLVTQYVTNISVAQINDSMRAADLVMQSRSASAAEPRVEVITYRMVNNTVTMLWRRTNSKGTACTAPTTTGLAPLMSSGNDLVVVVACSIYTAQISRFLGENLLGQASFTFREQIALRPRQAAVLNCIDCT
jgi:Flp pilus assembly protein TadG